MNKQNSKWNRKIAGVLLSSAVALAFVNDLSGWNEVPLFARLGVLEGY